MAKKAQRGSVRSKPKHIAKSEHHHYWPYLPMLAIIFAILSLTIFQPFVKVGVLSYATEIGRSSLLVSTNDRRAANNAEALELNDELNEAAQAKANDMVKRDYWSHNTPDGNEPWVFFEAANYDYIKAGENLAYGFSTSDDTVTGWMNSPSHRDNMLDTAFTEVGFGFANSDDFVDKGQQTIVVAMYGRPKVLSQNTSQPKQPSSQQAKVEQSQPKTLVDTRKNAKPAAPKETPIENSLPVNSDTDLAAEPTSQSVTRVESYSGGSKTLLFITGIVTGGVTVFLLLKHTVRIRHLIRDSEQFILHHPVLDTVLLAIVLAGTFLLQTNGVIK